MVTILKLYRRLFSIQFCRCREGDGGGSGGDEDEGADRAGEQAGGCPC